MGSKVISITEDVYNLLKSFQLANESFGDTIKRLCSQYSGKNLALWAKTLPEEKKIPNEIWDELELDISEQRNKNIIERDSEL